MVPSLAIFAGLFVLTKPHMPRRGETDGMEMVSCAKSRAGRQG